MTMPMAPIIEGRAALLIIDVQNGIVGPAQATSKPEFHATASASVIPNIRRLLNAVRAARLEVIYTVIDNLTQDGRDRSPDYKLSGCNIAKCFWEARVIDVIVRQGDEIVLPKTDQCIDHAVKDGADRDHYMFFAFLGLLETRFLVCFHRWNLC